MNKIYVCACASRSFIRKSDVAWVAAELAAAGHDVKLVADLCELSADRNAAMAELQGCTVVACHERAVRSLLDRGGVQAGRILNLREMDAEGVLREALGGETVPDDALVADKLHAMQAMLDCMPVKDGCDAWNPTIDKERCIECKKCLEFCPFGVYELVEGRVTVVHPHSCKNNCPACARQCPTKAIIFPKYTESPINGGLTDDDTATQLDTKTLYSSTLRERLKARRESVTLLKKED